MEDDQLIVTLKCMGIGPDCYQTVALLPLVHVAWADSEIQAGERILIMQLARKHFDLNEEGFQLLENWLTYRPTDAYLQAGQQVLIELAARTNYSRIQTNSPTSVVALCWDVAKAAGGVFGVGSIDSSERVVLTEIAAALNLTSEDAVDSFLKHMTTPPKPDETLNLGLAPSQSWDLHQEPRMDSPSYEAILIFEREGVPMKISLKAGQTSIGRSESNDVYLADDPEVSKEHCCIDIEEGHWRITDLGSSVGTEVNGQRVVKRRLFGGERVRVGNTRFDFWIRS